ncbi:sensor histidine kinase [Lacticaseibacillus kribbianus]|uniref:sensor histidine kinase n=1 Tax=Lacticaseibacillus kribbianus TaxID=2926292 RepID=UPI001CD742D5|nr:HAMP domain-containing sensor histidine kinase [Lacticaseibacillus kribbianus]
MTERAGRPGAADPNRGQGATARGATTSADTAATAVAGTAASRPTLAARLRARQPRRPATYAHRITRTYVVLLTIVVFVIGIVSVGVVAEYLIRSKQDDSAQLMGDLQDSFKNNRPDWDAWFSSSYRTHHAFVRVNVSGQGVNETYYAKNTKRFLKDTLMTYPLISHVQYQEDQGIYYYREAVVKKDGMTVDYEIWMSLNRMVNLVKLLLAIIVGITLIGLLAGAWATSILARRLNRPLAALTEAAKGIAAKENATHQEALPVAAGPAEVQQLSIEFNRLLAVLNAQVRRDNQFVSDASHELRTPLTAIRGHASLIRRHGSAHPEIVPESLAVIEDESLKMQRLIESLLTLSRMDHVQVARQPLDLSVLVQDTVDRYAAAQEPEVALEGGLWILADADSVTHILLCLLNNAAKYAPDAPVTITAQRAAGRIVLRVADLGPGIPDAAKDQVFDRFYRVDSSRSKKIAGTGLGLAIAARLAALSGATIQVTDNVPHGSVFAVSFEAADSRRD